MRSIKMYCKLGEIAPMSLFLGGLGEKLSNKIIRQLFYLAASPKALWKEPHVKHFSIEKYAHFYELREKNRILVRIIFTIEAADGDILLLAPFIKRQKRDTMRALEQSIKMMADIREHPEHVISFLPQ